MDENWGYPGSNFRKPPSVFFFQREVLFLWLLDLQFNQRGARLFAQHPGGTDVLRDAAGHDVLGTQGARCNG